jgi:nicotinamide mononucleotide transporter
MGAVIEVFGLVTGVLYLWYEIKHDNKMWYVGIIMALVYTYLFASESLYASMSYQIYYLVMSVYGIYSWRKDSAGESAIVVNRIKLLPAVISGILALVVFLVSYFLLSDYTDASQPFLDSLVTSLSLLATYWLSRSWIWQWVLWVIVNVCSVIMFCNQGMYPTALLYLFYTFSAIYGFYYWRNL